MTSSDDTPALFRLWSAIGLVAGALERRIWTQVGWRSGRPRLAYPNLYTMLVAPPGVGKYIIEDVNELWASTFEPGTRAPAFHVAPTSMTKASLVDKLAKSKTTRLAAKGPPVEYHSLLVAAEEFGVFLPAYDNEFIGTLNKIYNNPPVHSEERRHGPAREVVIDLPQLNILAGVQPGWLSEIFPEVAWSTGLTARIIMVYSSEESVRDPFAVDRGQHLDHDAVTQQLGELSQLYGELGWEPNAQERWTTWVMAGCPPVPMHSKLEHYNRRRRLHVLKLAMVSAISRGGRSAIALQDVDRAIEWLVEVEQLMPDIFRAMVGRSDHQVMEELHFFASKLWRVHSQEPISPDKFWAFLRQRVPSDKIQKILQAAERSGMIVRFAGTETFRPGARTEFEVE